MCGCTTGCVNLHFADLNDGAPMADLCATLSRGARVACVQRRLRVCRPAVARPLRRLFCIRAACLQCHVPGGLAASRATRAPPWPRRASAAPPRPPESAKVSEPLLRFSQHDRRVAVSFQAQSRSRHFRCCSFLVGACVVQCFIR